MIYESSQPGGNPPAGTVWRMGDGRVGVSSASSKRCPKTAVIAILKSRSKHSEIELLQDALCVLTREPYCA